MNPYASIIVLTTLILNSDGDALRLDLPFKTYGQNIVMNGKDITYNLNDLSNVGKEVLAKVDYRIADMPGTDVKDESSIADAFAGNLGSDWAKVQKKAGYIKHYAVTKADMLATYDKDGNKIPYAGADKDEPVKFVEWEETKKAVNVVIE